MLTRVKIQNFKSIGEPGVDLVLKPLTILVGPNGGGKSSVLELVALASQNFSPGGLMSFRRHASLMHKYGKGPANVLLEIDVPSMRKEVHQVKVFPNGSLDWGGSSQGSEVYNHFQTVVHFLKTTRGDVGYVNFLAEARNVGVRGENIVQILSKISGSREFDAKKRRIEQWASRFGLPDLRAGLWGNQLGSDFAEPVLNVPVELAQASSGSRQVLAMIVELFWAERGHIILVEEPEISLHPQGQIDLMELFGEAIKDQKQIMATTHSHYLLMAIGYGVQHDWIRKDDVAVYHIEKKQETGTVASMLELGEDGYLKDWVPSYNEVERKLMQAWPKEAEEVQA
jgi:predicted ATPase